MNKYETVIILDSKASEDERKETIKKVKELISRNGTINTEMDLGLKKLAYEIRKNKEGYYYDICFETNSAEIIELERLYRITDKIIKFIVIRQE